MWKVRELADKVTNVVMNYTEIEAKVREATNDDPWGATGTLKHELAQATFSYDSFPEVMGMLWKRIAENKRSPRRIYKSLLLIHHLLLNGSDRVIRATTDRLYEIRQLQDYHVVYEPGFNLTSIIPVDEYKDGEMNVRVKAKEIVDLVQDEEKLKDERKKSKKNRDKYVGIGSDRMTSRWGTSDFDDELKFPSKSSSSSKYDDFDTETGEEQTESTTINKSKSSPTTEEPKSSNNKIQVKLKQTSPVKDLDDDDDFDPRAGEALTGEFADFKSAFGATKTTTTNSTSSVSSSSLSNNDLFSVKPIQQPPTSFPSSSSADELDLLGLNIGGPSFPPQLNHFGNFGIQTITPQSPFSGISTSPTDPFGSFTSHSSVPAPTSTSLLLQPQQANNLNNNHNHHSQQQSQVTKKTLEGTTWSDLNFSLDDLNLTSKANTNTKTKSAAAQQQHPTMNQLLGSPNKQMNKLPF